MPELHGKKRDEDEQVDAPCYPAIQKLQCLGRQRHVPLLVRMLLWLLWMLRLQMLLLQRLSKLHVLCLPGTSAGRCSSGLMHGAGRPRHGA